MSWLPTAAAGSCPAPPHAALLARACRLRFGHFVFVNTGRMGKRRRRQRKQAGDEADSGSSTANGSSSSAASSSAASSSLGPLPAVSLLQGALLPSLFSFHPPLAFQALAFNGGQSWMVAVELGTLPPQEQAAGEQQAGSGSRASGGSSSGAAGGSPTAAAAADADAPTVEGWQAGQIARFAALRQLYSGIAAPLPPSSPLLQQATDGQVATAADMQPAEARRPLLLFSSLPLQAASIAADASLERDGAAAFRQSLALHLNGLASAPADASPQHVARMAAAQLAWLREQRRHPLLCAAHLEAAFGREWLQQLQVWLRAVLLRTQPLLPVRCASLCRTWLLLCIQSTSCCVGFLMRHACTSPRAGAPGSQQRAGPGRAACKQRWPSWATAGAAAAGRVGACQPGAAAGGAGLRHAAGLKHVADEGLARS